MNNTFTNNLIIKIEGASHAKEIKLYVRGLPKDIEIDENDINKVLAYRLGDESISTPRRDSNDYFFASGVTNGKTDGNELIIVIPNKDYDDTVYQNPTIVRPGHADLAQLLKYDGNVDIRGGGIASGRMTTPFVILGSICASYLKKQNIITVSRIKQIGNIKDESSFFPTISNIANLDTSFPALNNQEKMKEAIIKAKENNNSLGGIVETYTIGLPVGIGEPFFNGLESTLSHLIFSIPGINGLEFGEGFNTTNLTGAEYNDEPYYEDDVIKYQSNHNGGLSGGITNGNYLNFKTSIRPPSSISKTQNTIDIKTKQNVQLEIKGRHDSCFVHRVLHVINAVTNIAVVDQMLSINNLDTLDDCRAKIDQLDNQIMNLIDERFKITNNVGKIKRENNLPILNTNREDAIFNKASTFDQTNAIKEIYKNIMTESKKQQASYLLVAGNTSYSFSKLIHNELGNNQYQMQEITSLEKVLTEQSPLGINVTNPFKQEANKLCVKKDQYANKTGITNLLVKNDKDYIGYNTDYVAFLNTIKHYNIDLKDKNVIILGNGATAKTIKQVLLDNDVKSIQNLVRTKKDSTDLLLTEATFDAKCDIIINATSYGVYPNLVNTSLIDLNNYPNVKLVMDVNYNPSSSSLLNEAKSHNIKTINGLYMLVENGRLSEELWQNKSINEKVSLDICKKIEKESLNIVLIGQTLSGKSSIGQILSKTINKSLWDNDFELAKANLDLKNIKDEKEFRNNEASYLKEASTKLNTLIIPGAGAIENQDTMSYLSQNSIFVYLDAPLEVIKNRSLSNDRPMLQDENSINAIFNRRKPLYERYADITILINNQTINEIIEEIMVKLNEYYDHKWS